MSGRAILSGLLLFRLFWGFVGPRHARFSDFMRGPRETLLYLRGVLTLRAPRHLGHNPAGGLMIVVLLLSLTATTIAGLMLYGADKGLGPLAGLLVNSSDSTIHTIKELHEFFANFTVILIAGHLLGVIWGKCVTPRKPGPCHDHRAQAGLIQPRVSRDEAMYRPAGLVAVLILAGSLLAAVPAVADRDHDKARQLRGAGQILSLETIIANHRRQHSGGQLLEAALESKRDRYVYELKMLGDDGVVREFEYDARSGELWRVERD